LAGAYYDRSEPCSATVLTRYPHVRSAITAIFAYLAVDDVNALYAEFAAKNAIIPHALDDKPWGGCGFLGKSPANPGLCRPAFRFDVARRSEMTSPGIPG
jgi:hypothetical protein